MANSPGDVDSAIPQPSLQGSEANSLSPWLRPGWPEWLAATSILLALTAFGLIKISCVDVPWHLATARLAEQQGHWPTTNSFSYTYPEYPLYQQYPVFQSALYAVFKLGGWAGLTVFSCFGWLVVIALFVRWGGPIRTAAALHLPWMFGAIALQRRMILRPDLLSVLWFTCLLLLISAYLKRSRWWIALVPLVHLAWVNSHQLFPLSIATQILLIIHLTLSRLNRWNIDDCDRNVPIWQAVFAVIASVGVSFLTPLGSDIVNVFAHTSGSLSHHRTHVQEFAFVWQRPVELRTAIICAVLGGYAIWRSRHKWSPLEVGLWLGTLLLLLMAVRGLVFFGLVSVAIFGRILLRTQDTHVIPVTASRALIPRVAMIALTLLLAGNVVFHRWVRPPLMLGGTQPGFGRSIGDWPDAAIEFIETSPPPGEMMNMTWSLANATIWYIPEHRPFVDPRFEAYPRQFLVDSIESAKDDTLLTQLIDKYQPSWIFANHRVTGVRDRIANLLRSGNWKPVYADTQTIVIVRCTPETAEYLSKHATNTEDFRPHDLIDTPRDLRARQRVCFAQLLSSVDQNSLAKQQLELASEEAKDNTNVKALVDQAMEHIDRLVDNS